MEQRLALGLKEAAEAVGLSHWQLRKYIREGKLRAVRLGMGIPAKLNAGSEGKPNGIPG